MTAILLTRYAIITDWRCRHATYDGQQRRRPFRALPLHAAMLATIRARCAMLPRIRMSARHTAHY